MISISKLNRKEKASSQAFFTFGHDQNLWIIVFEDVESYEGDWIMMFLFIFLHELTSRA
jgi:hypothetical protein